MNTVTLHDGAEEVTTIGVMLWYRNNADYIRKFVKPFFDRVEALYTYVEFKYFIMENDSTDDTSKELTEFMHDREGFLVSENLGLNDIAGGVSFDRINRMAYIRNYLLQRVRQHIPELQWVLVLDSDVYIDELIIRDMIESKPKLNNIGMMCANGVAVYMQDGQTEIPDTFMHYYDSFAFVDKNDMSYHPLCASSQCISSVCNAEIPQRLDFKGQIDVRSAWGGCVMIDARVFDHPRVEWKSMLITPKRSICEHVYFCDSIHISSGKRIVVCGDVYAYYQRPLVEMGFHDIKNHLVEKESIRSLT